MSCIEVIGNNFKWANEVVEKLGSSHMENPSIGSAFYVAILSTVGIIAFPAKTTYDLFKRSVTQLSPIDFLASIGALAATFLAFSVAPVVFVIASAVLVFNVCAIQGAPTETQNEASVPQNVYVF